MQNAEEGICCPVGLNGISKPRSRSIFSPLSDQIVFQAEPVCSFLCVRLHVCLFRAIAAEQRRQPPFCHCQKTFPVCPLHCGCQPTNQRHAAGRQRGSDANLQNLRQPPLVICLPPWHGAKQNGATPHATTIWLHCVEVGTSWGTMTRRKKTLWREKKN